MRTYLGLVMLAYGAVLAADSHITEGTQMLEALAGGLLIGFGALLLTLVTDDLLGR